MKLSEFDYNLPKDRIAQYPEKARDSSKLLVIDRGQKKFEHRTFRDLNELLYPGDVLVINNTRVIPARVHGRKPSGGKVEVLLIKELRTNTWEALIKGLHEGAVNLRHGITAHVLRSNGTSTVTFTGDDIKNKLNTIGVMPLPPYIKRPANDLDAECYQTVYAEKEGAVAAPTAGLHFTGALLGRLKQNGIKIAKLTLHVGCGTFKPVLSSEIEKHLMAEEQYEIPEDTADIINNARSNGNRIIAVGTTVSRTLESSAMNGPQIMLNPDGKNAPPELLNGVKAGAGKASIFIYPGYKFRVIDALITNFHLPRSTPLMLTSAFSGLPLLKKAYGEALNSGYRFFSYGDAMIII